MNPYRIYRDEAADALRRQATASSYSSFVAMPFCEDSSYQSREIFEAVICRAVEAANNRSGLPRSFVAPRRVDPPQGAVVITEEIVLGILESHIFIADLTLQNAGVVLETGIAFGTKSNRQIVLITQHDPEELHFDVRANYVNSYRLGDSVSESVSKIAEAIYSAAQHFEEQVKRYLVDVRRRLSPEAHAALKYYAEIQQQNIHLSLHSESRGPNFEGADGARRFDAVAAEQRSKDLLWTDYAVGGAPQGDAFGMHATEFGWAIIESLWSDLERPEGAKVPASPAS